VKQTHVPFKPLKAIAYRQKRSILVPKNWMFFFVEIFPNVFCEGNFGFE
jgi:hypothetical protein